MLKATAGGGGRGIRMVASGADLSDAYQRTSDEALRAFGNGVVFLERLVTGARHVEVQVIADGHGTAWALGVRDCSVQRRNQKVIEESASPLLGPEQTAELKASAERLAARGRLPRRRHGRVPLPPRREAVRLPGGQHPAAGRAPDHRGHHRHRSGQGAVARRRRRPARGRSAGRGGARHRGPAERRGPRPRLRAVPGPDRAARAARPGPGSGSTPGSARATPSRADFDSMIAKIIAYGRDRDEALARLRRAMAETTVVIEGGATNKSFVLDLLDQPEVDRRGGADTGWIDRVRARAGSSPTGTPGSRWPRPRSRPTGTRRRSSSAAAADDRPRWTPAGAARVGRPLELKLRGVGYQVTGRPDRPAPVPGRRRRRRGRASVDVEVDRLDPFTPPDIGQRAPFRLVTATHGPIHLVEVDGVTHRVSRDEGGVIRSPAPALVVATPRVGSATRSPPARRSSCWRA